MVVSHRFSLVRFVIASVNAKQTSAESAPNVNLNNVRCRDHVTNDTTAMAASSKTCVSATPAGCGLSGENQRSVFCSGCLNRNNSFAGLEFSLEFDLGLG